MKFQDLIVDTKEIEEELAARIVAPYVKYTSAGSIVFMAPFKKLRDEEKVIIYLVAKIGLKFIQGDNVKIGISNKGISRELNLSYSSVRVYLSRFRRRGWILTDPATKEHQITNQAVYDLNEKIGGEKHGK